MSFVLKLLKLSKAQLSQDVFVACELELWKVTGKSRFFVEFGVADGVDLSNSFLLEREFGWTGVACEPAEIWHSSLKKNRKCKLDFRCVSSESHMLLEFNEAADAKFSTLNSYASDDVHRLKRDNGRIYSVKTVSLNDLLDEHEAPLEIDYLSIDTEGSEYDILSTFNFNKYKIKIITVEHNYGLSRNLIGDLLRSHGYIRVLERFTKFDDWYILRSA